MHRKQSGDLLLFFQPRVVNIFAAFQTTAVDPREGEFAALHHGYLENQSGQWLVVCRRATDRFACIRVNALHRRQIRRAGQESDHGVQERLDPFFFKALPQSTGTSLRSIVALRMALISISSLMGVSAR